MLRVVAIEAELTEGEPPRWSAPMLRAAFDIDVIPEYRNEGGFEGYRGTASARLYPGWFDERRSRDVVSTGIRWGGPVRGDEPLYEALSDLQPDGSEWVVEFDRMKIARDFRDDDLEMRLVCGVLRHLSINRPVVAVICVEPMNWQSLKVDDRRGQRDVLRDYWMGHGFNTVIGEAHVARRVRDFEAPVRFRSWGPYGPESVGSRRSDGS